jgi:hypothetical protein
MYTKFKDGKQDYYPINENIILIEAKDEKEALQKAIERGKIDEGDSSGTYLYDRKPAIMIYGGIRKITQCDDSDQRPGDGTEVTYSEFLVDSNEKLLKLIKGDPVDIFYDD